MEKDQYKVTRLKPFGLLIEPKIVKNNDKNKIKNDICLLDINSLRHFFKREQLLVLRGFHTFSNAEEFANYCSLWGEISLWPFGKVLELVEQENPQDHIFDNNYVPLHWDGMYRPQIPEYQIFHCVQAPLPGQGGRTTFSNTALALINAPKEVRSLWDKVTGSYERKMEFYNSKTVSPIVTTHPQREFPIIRYNEPPASEKGFFLNPPKLKFTGVAEEELKKVHQSLQESLYSPNNFYAHEWQEGDVVIADNYSLLHGRELFIKKASRHLRRVHVLGDPPFDNPGLEFHKNGNT